MFENIELNLKPCVLFIHYHQRTNVQNQDTIKYSVGQSYQRVSETTRVIHSG